MLRVPLPLAVPQPAAASAERPESTRKVRRDVVISHSVSGYAKMPETSREGKCGKGAVHSGKTTWERGRRILRRSCQKDYRAVREGVLSSPGAPQSWCSAGSARRRKSAARVSAAGGTECAGVTSEIDVQTRYENVSLTHTAENGSDFQPRQCTSEIVSHRELLRISCAIVARAPALRFDLAAPELAPPDHAHHPASPRPSAGGNARDSPCSSWCSRDPLVRSSERRDAVRRQRFLRAQQAVLQE